VEEFAVEGVKDAFVAPLKGAAKGVLGVGKLTLSPLIFIG
jgi:hypothetical protein